MWWCGRRSETIGSSRPISGTTASRYVGNPERLINFDADRLDDRTPFDVFRLEQLAKLFRRRAPSQIATLGEAVFDRRVGKRAVGIDADLADDLTRCLGRNEQRLPCRHIVIRDAG